MRWRFRLASLLVVMLILALVTIVFGTRWIERERAERKAEDQVLATHRQHLWQGTLYAMPGDELRLLDTDLQVKLVSIDEAELTFRWRDSHMKPGTWQTEKKTLQQQPRSGRKLGFVYFPGGYGMCFQGIFTKISRKGTSVEYSPQVSIHTPY